MAAKSYSTCRHPAQYRDPNGFRSVFRHVHAFQDATASPTYTPTARANATPGVNFFTTHHPNLTWNRISWAAGYQIQIDDDPNFRSPITVPDRFSADTLSYTVEDDLANGIYYWHVCAEKNLAACGAWSAKESFIVSAP